MTTAAPQPPAAPPQGPRPPSRLRRWAAGAAGYVGSAPGTYIWLLVLGLNTFALARMSPRVRRYFLFTHSTNLDQLRHHPVKVLITSAFWTETPSFLFWFLLFNLIHVPVERRLGTWRWLAVAVTAHVGATLVSEGMVDVLINTGALPHRTAYALDIGVSYALAGSAGVLTWLVARPLRWYYLGAASAFFVLLIVTDWDFTNLGHITAFLIGVACFPVARGAPPRRGAPGWLPWLTP
ncbi:rhomboid-like protein [Streptacidiphilus cavernicola]|uniref:Rhomboid-like protein n=1 Tax=Streptacidiphilus cavernicola TaxID=3342716 RepID=A0ABV6VUA0_9ACTN